MSKDFKLKNKCPHFVMGEWLAPNEDRKTLEPIKNPSSNQVEVYINGNQIPKRGLYSSLSISTRVSQPFEISSNKNKVEFSINGGADQTVDLPTGNNVSADQIADAIEEGSEKLEVESSNGKVVLEVEESVNKVQKSLFLKGGSAHSSLGLPERRFYKNRKVHPGWGIVRDEDQFGQLDKKIVFEESLKAIDDVIEVSYYTRQRDCRRCGGLGIEDDIRHDQSGDPVFIRNEGLLLQEVQKIVFTRKGSNVFFKWYGTSLYESIGEKIIEGGSALRSQFLAEISNVLERYRQIKTQQANVQPVTNEEFLLQVDNINIEQGVDPTVFRIEIDLVNRNNEVKNISKKVAINSSDEGGPDKDEFRRVLQRG